MLLNGIQKMLIVRHVEQYPLGSLISLSTNAKKTKKITKNTINLELFISITIV